MAGGSGPEGLGDESPPVGSRGKMYVKLVYNFNVFL